MAEFYTIYHIQDIKVGCTKQYNNRISQNNMSKVDKDNQRRNQSESNRRVKQRPVTCPHCGKSGGHKTMPRWHFDNCKYKKEIKES